MVLKILECVYLALIYEKETHSLVLIDILVKSLVNNIYLMLSFFFPVEFRNFFMNSNKIILVYINLKIQILNLFFPLKTMQFHVGTSMSLYKLWMTTGWDWIRFKPISFAFTFHYNKKLFHKLKTHLFGPITCEGGNEQRWSSQFVSIIRNLPTNLPVYH